MLIPDCFITSQDGASSGIHENLASSDLSIAFRLTFLPLLAALMFRLVCSETGGIVLPVSAAE